MIVLSGYGQETDLLEESGGYYLRLLDVDSEVSVPVSIGQEDMELVLRLCHDPDSLGVPVGGREAEEPTTGPDREDTVPLDDPDDLGEPDEF